MSPVRVRPPRLHVPFEKHRRPPVFLIWDLDRLLRGLALELGAEHRITKLEVRDATIGHDTCGTRASWWCDYEERLVLLLPSAIRSSAQLLRLVIAGSRPVGNSWGYSSNLVEQLAVNQ